MRAARPPTARASLPARAGAPCDHTAGRQAPPRRRARMDGHVLPLGPAAPTPCSALLLLSLLGSSLRAVLVPFYHQQHQQQHQQLAIAVRAFQPVRLVDPCDLWKTRRAALMHYVCLPCSPLLVLYYVQYVRAASSSPSTTRRAWKTQVSVPARVVSGAGGRVVCTTSRDGNGIYSPNCDTYAPTVKQSPAIQ